MNLHLLTVVFNSFWLDPILTLAVPTIFSKNSVVDNKIKLKKNSGQRCLSSKLNLQLSNDTARSAAEQLVTTLKAERSFVPGARLAKRA